MSSVSLVVMVAIVREEIRWWLLPGEELGRGKGWSVAFAWDDGNLWGLGVVTRAGRKEAHWDYSMDHLFNLPDGVEHAAVCDILRRHFRLRRENFKPAHRSALNAIAAHMSKDDYVTGRRLRAAGVDQHAIEALVPRHVEREDAEGKDFYRLTLAGYDESDRSAESAGVVGAVLDLLRDKFETDPDVRGFSWEELRTREACAAAGFTFSRGVMNSTLLCRRGGGSGEGDLFGR